MNVLDEVINHITNECNKNNIIFEWNYDTYAQKYIFKFKKSDRGFLWHLNDTDFIHIPYSVIKLEVDNIIKRVN